MSKIRNRDVVGCALFSEILGVKVQWLFTGLSGRL